MPYSRKLLSVLMSLVALCSTPAHSSVSMTALDRGFQLLYNLDFDGAHTLFADWEKDHPEDPMGPTAEAASLLFSQFNRLGVLESQFFVDDKTFDSRSRLSPGPEARKGFDKALEKSQSLARERLKSNSKDKDALFAMTLTNGLEADYAALIEKRNLVSLRFTKQSAMWAEQTLAVDPGCYDAHIASGVSKYLIGSMAVPVRWLAHLGGVAGDKQQGIKELTLVAARGHYLAPFANILLAIAYVREHDKQHARALLATLRDQFPSNPLFAREIAKLDAHR